MTISRGRQFLLTRPLRGATRSSQPGARGQVFLLTRPLRGATQRCKNFELIPRFLLTRPLRGATYTPFRKRSAIHISTHTPLAGRDLRIRLF